MSRDLKRYLELINLGATERERAELSTLITQVGIPPDLCYLRDGLERTRRLLVADAAAFDELLKASGNADTTKDWLARVDLALSLVDSISTDPHDPVHLSMARLSQVDGHPLNKYCMGICPYWAVQFYEVPQTEPDEMRDAYADLHALVSRYLLVAQARVRGSPSPDPYASQSKKAKLSRDGSRKLPAGRVESAALGLRRLGASQYRQYISLLAERSDRLDDRVAEAEYMLDLRASEDSSLSKDEVERILASFRLLDELIWQEFDARRRRIRGLSRAARKLGPDGYVRLGKSGLLLATEALDVGGALIRILRDSTDAPSKNEPVVPGAPAVDTADQADVIVLELDDPHGTSSQRRIEALRQAKSLVRYSTWPTLDRSTLNAWQADRLRSALTALQQIDLKRYLLASLATGRDFAGSGVSVFKQMPEDPPEVSFLNDVEPSWLLRVDPPAWRDTAVVAGERPLAEAIRLPDVLGFSACLRGTKAPKLRWNESIRGEAENWLQETLWDTSIKLRGLHGFLPRRLMEESGGDLALTRLLTGATVGHAGSAIHYCSIDEGRAAEIYRRAIPPEPGKPDLVMPASAGLAIGARRVPVLEAIKDLVDKAKMRVGGASGVDRRNALTFYTLLGFNLGVAGRAFEIRKVADFVSLHGMAVLSEKGSVYNNRLVPLAPTLRSQLSAYLNALGSWGYSPTGAHGLFAFWPDKGLPVEPFSPKHFEELARPLGFELELYALRRFMRSELIQRGTDPEDIDALMGHWFNLLSPHDPLSTYSPRRLQRLGSEQIERILKDIGYASLP